jgi:hypothetical protein
MDLPINQCRLFQQGTRQIAGCDRMDERPRRLREPYVVSFIVVTHFNWARPLAIPLPQHHDSVCRNSKPLALFLKGMRVGFAVTGADRC